MLSLGLARSFRQAGLKVRAFKKGPDYIDAAWLSFAARSPQANLDPFFTPGDRLRELFRDGCRGYDLAVVEGNRGLFDGLDIGGSCSTAEVARVLDAPVLLVVDCTKMTRTAAALVRGCLDFEPGLRIGGVILNRTGNPRHQAMVRSAVEELAGVPVLGVLPRKHQPFIFERHMGLSSLAENADADQALDALALFLREHVDLERILALAGAAPNAAGLSLSFAPPADRVEHSFLPPAPSAPKARIGIALDAAFWFYYRENLDALTRAGATLLPLSLLDAAPWPTIDGLYIGGGLPELYAGALTANSGIRRHVAALSEQGLPIYAECGGFMYLSQGIRYKERDYPMAGVFPCRVEFCPHPQGLGYVEGSVVADNPFLPKGLPFRGHEFHFSRYTPEAGHEQHFLLRLDKGSGMSKPDAPPAYDGLLRGNTFAAYTHVYAPAVPCWAENFVSLCAERCRTTPL